MIKPNRLQLIVVLVSIAIVIAIGLWWMLKPGKSPPGIASGNGRIEATEIDIATKAPGRILEITVSEGDFVHAGETLARMDTQVLNAQKAEAEAQVQQAENAHITSQAIVLQRESEQNAAKAVVAQHQAELEAASKRLKRSQRLVSND